MNSLGMLQVGQLLVILKPVQQKKRKWRTGCVMHHLGAWLSLLLLLVTLIWETTTTEFQWQNSTFRIVLAIMLSVPAAYLARESAKHREQHKIKIEIASRLFAAKDYSRVGADPYPVNVHEIVMELIKKLELNKQSKNDKNG